MKRGQWYILKRGKRRHSVEILHDHSKDDPPFPAVTVRYRSEQWIVGVSELTNPADPKEEERKKLHEFLCSKHVSGIIEAISNGMKTVREIAEYMDVQMIDILSKFKKAKRLGIINEVGGVITATRKEGANEQEQAGKSES